MSHEAWYTYHPPLTLPDEDAVQLAELPNDEAAILRRLTGSSGLDFSAATAEGFLALEFDPADTHRMHELSTKARGGKLTRKEQTEIEAYDRVNGLLGILKSNARRAQRIFPKRS